MTRGERLKEKYRFLQHRDFTGMEDTHGSLQGITEMMLKPFQRAICREIFTIPFYSIKLYLEERAKMLIFGQVIFIKCSSYSY